MAKFCGKCGSPLDKTTGLCPNCDADKLQAPQQKGPFKVAGDLSPRHEQAERKPASKAGSPDRAYWEKGPTPRPQRDAPSKHTGRRVAAAILVLAIVIGGAGFAGWKMGWRPLRKSAPSISADGFTLLADSFTERKITDRASALAAISDAANDLGIEDVTAEFSNCKVDTVSGNTYYRFYQEYQGIPVYGRSVVVAADENGNSLMLSGNYVAPTDVNMNDLLSPVRIKQALSEFIAMKCGTIQYSLQEVGEKSLYLYFDEEVQVYRVVYVVQANIAGMGAYHFFVDARTAEVIRIVSLLSNDYQLTNGTVAKVNGRGQVKDQQLDVYRQNDCYLAADPSKNIELYKMKGSFFWFYSKNTNDLEEVRWDISARLSSDPVEVDALANIEAAYDYYKSVLDHRGTDGKGASTIYIFTDCGFYADAASIFGTDHLYDNAASGSSLEDNVTAIYIGKPNNNDYALSADLDVMAHEYTHAVIKFACDLGLTDESSAINEGVSDIFGELVETWKTGSCDWAHGNRHLDRPEATGYPSMLSDASMGNEDFAHGRSTIISHAAYLMSTGVADDPGLQALSAEDIAHLFYETLYTLPSDCTFSQFRSLTQNMAKIMCEQGRLTQKQVQCVSSAFFEGGITPAAMLVAEKLTLDVYGADGQPYDNYTLYARHHSGAEKKYAGETVAEGGISFPTTGIYDLVIEDNANTDNKTSITVQVTDHGGIQKMPVYTQCGTGPVELIPALTPPPGVSFARFENNGEEYAVITARDINGNTAWSVTTPSYPMTELCQLEEIGTFDDLFIYNESGTITAVDVRTGALLWKNSEFGGAQIAFAADEKGIYLCGYYGPSFYAVSYQGNTLRRIESFDNVCYWPGSIELEEDRICVHLVYDSLAPLGEGEHTHYISRDTLEVLPDGGSWESQTGGASIDELSALLDQYFREDFVWNDDDIISGMVFNGSFINDTDALFDLRVQTKSAEWTHQANVLVGTVTINANTLAGYIEWHDGSKTPIDLSKFSYAESYQAILGEYPEYEEASWGKEYTEYALYDIDKNGIPELIVKLANAWGYDVYTYDGQESVLCGEIFDSLSGNAAALYEYSGNGIVIRSGGMGTMRIESIYTQQLVDGKLISGEYIASTEEMSFDELYSILETYTRLEDFYMISDFTPFN